MVLLRSELEAGAGSGSSMVRLLWLAFLIVAAPPPAQAAAQTRPQDPSPEVVENRVRARDLLTPTLRQVAEAGSEEDPDSVLSEPTNMLFGPDGTLLVPDEGSSDVKVYAPDGRLLRTIGRPGRGPGEFSWILTGYWGKQGDLIVEDVSSRSRIRYRLDGEFLDSERFTGFINAEPIVPLGDGTYLKATNSRRFSGRVGVPRDAVDPAGKGLIAVRDQQGHILRTFGQIEEDADPVVQKMMNLVSAALLPEGRAVAGFRYRADLHIYEVSTGRLETVIRRPLPFRLEGPPRSERRDDSGAGPPGANSFSFREEPYADPVTLAVATDPAGRIWALTSLLPLRRIEEREAEGRYEAMTRLEVYDGTGILLAILDSPHTADMMAFDPDGRLWLLDSRYTALARGYQVTWP